MKKIALRIDDIGASSKKYEVYSKKLGGFGNILFLKYLKSLKAWGPYEEMSPELWEKAIALLEKYHAKLTVAVTGAWVEYSGELVPFDEKFPKVIPVIKKGIEKGVLQIASHGLTHCVLKDNLFRPKMIRGNRTYHREFWDWLPYETHEEHLTQSKEILERSFGQKIDLLVPPGNVFCDHTIKAAKKLGFKYINCNTNDDSQEGLEIISNNYIFDFHDKEMVELGLSWLEEKLISYKDHEFVFVKELVQ